MALRSSKNGNNDFIDCTNTYGSLRLLFFTEQRVRLPLQLQASLGSLLNAWLSDFSCGLQTCFCGSCMLGTDTSWVAISLSPTPSTLWHWLSPHNATSTTGSLYKTLASQIPSMETARSGRCSPRALSMSATHLILVSEYE
jgi:hypothetical protein